MRELKHLSGKDSPLTSDIKRALGISFLGNEMSHVALLLREYLAELNERITKLEELYDRVQTINNQASKLNEKFDCNIRTLTEQMQIIKGAVQESQEFISLFNKTFDEINLKQQKLELQNSDQSTTEVSECLAAIPLPGAIEVTSSHIGVNLSELEERDSLDKVIDKPAFQQNAAETNGNNKDDGSKRSLKDRFDE